jgi:ACS family allantoate permease-like MFS transporter
MIGTLIFSAPTAPTYLPGKIAILALFVGIIPVVLTLRWLNIVANRNKAAALEAMIKENSWTEADTERERSKSAFMDYTDKKNPFFVYLP